ncbi:DUF3139 domain-containing protein [Viridibacillus arvi]|uniref:DUF3139 domain-containing protein n=1 Tax=Viridibacillus arvi TaxID=263475 RepID=A0A0M0LJ89_9BACL|nr:DUF3139 domain-containing protein [Viridibacillus arvi]KOO51046.1 hypothetical protein AMD00_00575 [Viridibacillus arvi]
MGCSTIKKFAIFITIITVVLLITPLVGYGYVKYKLFILEKDTYNYLLEKYDKNDFKIETNFGMKGPLYTSTVVFEDEKDIEYIYINNQGNIVQIIPDPSIYNFKHTEKPSLE